MIQRCIKGYLLENDKSLDIIKIPYNSLANLLRYEVPEQYCERSCGDWFCDVYYTTRSNGVQVALVTGTLTFGNYSASPQLIAEYESKAIYINNKPIAYWEKECCIQELLQDFVDDVFLQHQKLLNYNERMIRLKEEHDKKQQEIENWENNH